MSEPNVNIVDEVRQAAPADRIPLLVQIVQSLEDKLSLLEQQNRALRAAIDSSELFFSISEVNLLSRSKLPRVEISASDPVEPTANFYGSETENGISYRWMGPKRQTTFLIPIDRSVPRTLTLRVLSEIADGFFKATKLYIDGVLSDVSYSQDSKSFLLTVQLAASGKCQDTQVVILTPGGRSPSGGDASNSDSRTLSLAFLSLEVE